MKTSGNSGAKNVHTFKSKLERLSDEANYFVIPVPKTLTKKLKTKGPVPVQATVNGSTPFLVSLHPRGDGSHGMRVKKLVRDEVGLKEGNAVLVKITIIDRDAEMVLDTDVEDALREQRIKQEFAQFPKGQARFLIRLIDQAKRPETRAKRIEELVSAVIAYNEKKV